jgi:hypothetical protein
MTTRENEKETRRHEWKEKLEEAERHKQGKETAERNETTRTKRNLRKGEKVHKETNRGKKALTFLSYTSHQLPSNRRPVAIFAVWWSVILLSLGSELP